MDFTALKAAVSGRGFSRLVAADLGLCVNDANHELDSLEPRWPYLFVTTTGTAPLTVADVDDVSLVINTTGNLPLAYRDYEDLVNEVGDLTQTGTDPWAWYWTTSSTSSISAYPVTTRTLKVSYWKVSVDLSAGGDTPLSPARWHQLIVDMAVRNAHVMRSMDIPPSLEVQIDRKLAQMRTDLHYRQVQGPSMVLPMGCEDY